MLLDLLVELVLIAVLLGGSYLGYVKGLFRLVAGPIRILGGLLLSAGLSIPIGEQVIAPIIRIPITNYIFEALYDRINLNAPSSAAEDLPTLIKIASAVFGYDVDYDSDSSADVITAIAESVALPMARLLSILISFVILLAMSGLIIRLLMRFICFLADFCLVSWFDRALGVVLSGAMSFIVAWVTVCAFDFLIHMPIFYDMNLVKDFSGGPLYDFFVGFNPIRLLLSF